MKTISKNIEDIFWRCQSIGISLEAVLIVAFAIATPGILHAKMKAHQSDFKDTALIYEAQDRRDPFQPLVQFGNKAGKPDSAVLKLTNQHRPLKLLGIMSGPQGYHAMIQNSEGTRYIVNPGKVLLSEGVMIKQITDTQLVLEYLESGEGTHQEGLAHGMVLSFHE